MSWWRKEEEEKETVEEDAEKVEEDREAENRVFYSPLPPQTSSIGQVQELTKAEENRFWGWLALLSLFSGLTMPADRKGSQQEPVCCLLEKKRPPDKTCPECEILFCRQCEALHYNPGFIEHCILGHGEEEPEGQSLGIISHIMNTDSSKLAAAPGRKEDEEIKRK